MKTQNIVVEGLPEGWRAVAYRIPFENKDYILHGEQVLLCCWPTDKKYLIVEKIQPRKIVLEEISKEEYHRLFNDERCPDIYNMRRSYWREVKETDIQLTNEEPKLSLSVCECKGLFEGNQTSVNKVKQFIKDK